MRRHMRKLKKLLRSRLLWSCVFILSEFALMLYATFWAAYTQGYSVIFFVISIVVVVTLLLSNENSGYKTVWIAQPHEHLLRRHRQVL